MAKISYDPLFGTLEEKGVRLFDIEHDCKISSATLAKLRKGESIQLKTIAKICVYLGVPIEKAVYISGDHE